MTKKSISRASVLALLVIVGLVGALGSAGRQDTGKPLREVGISTSSEHDTVVVRGYPMDWYQLVMPSGWHWINDSLQRTAYDRDPADIEEDETWTKVEFRDRESLSSISITELPSGTVTTQLKIGDYQAVRYLLPIQTTGVLSHSVVYYNIPTANSGDGFMVRGLVANPATSQLLNEKHQVMQDMVESIEFHNLTAAEADLEYTENNSPAMPLLARYIIGHPSGWVVTNSIGGIHVAGTVTGESVQVDIVPAQDPELWEVGTEIARSEIGLRLGPNGVQSIGDQVVTDYVLLSGELPSRVTVTTPSLVVGSDEYWQMEMLIASVLYSVGINYDTASNVIDPYP